MVSNVELCFGHKTCMRKEIINGHLVGTHFRMIKPLFTTNPESPWQLVWNAIVNLWGNDPYKLFVFGKHAFSRLSDSFDFKIEMHLSRN